ncbi:hypothetical protein C5167_000581 [Papaver somniferum]|uniref:TNase-like domain-containing protein n=1 Tax=Papaver somniferum TaxID=3469 RepID=A0A4Y7KWA0_PAPSO|nr:uncharacterized 38.1 kDa protein-like isoform X1 [Papaver somniferum]RZC76458.1 hypothetical protein C5167_000581 [Papaver somniferum]
MGIFSSLCRGVGNTLIRILCGICFSSTTDDQDFDTSTSDHHGHAVSQPTNSVSALALDLFHFDNTCQVPEQLSEHVTSSKKAQARWYQKLLKAWKDAKPPTKTPEQASRLVMQALHQHQKADVEGLLKFYGLPVLHEHQIEIPAVVVFPPDEVKFKLQTVRVDAKAVDGDGLTVYVDAADHREALSVPSHVLEAVLERSRARASKDYPKADALHKTIIDAGYRMLKGSNNVDILARKYRIRLRGIDAPENRQPFGKEAKEELTCLVQGKCLNVHVYGEDQYGRLVGDVYCNGKFAREIMLKKGLAWHYAAYDKRPELIEWARKARAAGVGLWASSDPKEPWEWRKNNSRSGKLEKLN